MFFTHDTEVALAFAAALVNTDVNADRSRRLPDVAALDDFMSDWNWTGSRTHDDRKNSRRSANFGHGCARCGSRTRTSVVVIANRLLTEFHALPQLVKHDEWDYHLHATPGDAPLAARMGVEAAMAIVDVVRADELDRLRICGNFDCRDVLVDLSRNRSKRYCDLSCSNLAAVRAYRSRGSGSGRPDVAT